MPGTAGPNLGLVSGYSVSESGWGVGGFNPNMQALDALAQLYIWELALDTPPGSPSAGEVYSIGFSPTGAWVGHDGELALWTGAAWRYFTPMVGWVANTPKGLLVYDGSDWEVPLNLQPTITLTEKYIGTPASSAVIARWAIPSERYFVYSGTSTDDRFFGLKSSEIRPATRPSSDTVLTLNAINRAGTSTLIANVTITNAATRNTINWYPSSINRPIPGGSFLEVVAPAGSLNGMADIYMTLLLGFASDLP